MTLTSKEIETIKGILPQPFSFAGGSTDITDDGIVRYYISYGTRGTCGTLTCRQKEQLRETLGVDELICNGIRI